MTAPVFLTDTARLSSGPRVRLDGAEGRHAAAVRRLQPGEPLELTDGAGLVAACVVVSAGRDALECDVLTRRTVPAPAPRLVVVQALPKGDRGELAVELLTEVGVDEVLPWSAARCVTQWRGERGVKALARWRAHAREAAKQSRRAWVPAVGELASTEAVLERIGTAALAVVLHEEAAEPLTALTVPAHGVPALSVPAHGEILVVVGPEGGIREDELAAFGAAGARACRLGPTVLRTSTAGVAAAAVLLAGSGRWD